MCTTQKNLVVYAQVLQTYDLAFPHGDLYSVVNSTNIRYTYNIYVHLRSFKLFLGRLQRVLERRLNVTIHKTMIRSNLWGSIIVSTWHCYTIYI